MKTSAKKLKSSVPRAIMQNLKHQDWRVRKGAVAGLREVDFAISLPILANALHDESHFVGETACRVMEEIGKPSILNLLESLKDKNLPVRDWVVWTLMQIGDEQVVPELIPLLNDADNSVRSRAFQALQHFRDPSAIPALMESLKDPDKDWRNAALETLMPFGLVDLLPFCLNIIENEEPDEYEIDRSAQLAARAIARMGEPVYPTLFQLAQDKRAYVRQYAAQALGFLRSTIANPYLVALLKDEDTKVRSAAVHAIGWSGNTEAIAPLLEMVNDPSRNITLSLPTALGDIGDLSVIPFLIQGLQQEMENVDRGLYAQAMAYWHWNWKEQNEDASIILSAIDAFEKSQDQRLRISAIWLLHSPLYKYRTLVENWLKAKKPIKSLEVPAVYIKSLDTLLAALRDNNPDIRLSAIYTHYFGLKDKRIAPALAERLSDNIPLIAYKAAEWMTHIPDKRAIPNLSKAVEYPDERVQVLSLEALGIVGQTKTLGIVLSKLNHPSKRIRRAAASALGAIDSPAILSMLIDRFEQEQDEWTRASIVSSICRLKSREAIPFLIGVVALKSRSDDDPYWFNSIRDRAVMGLADLNAEEALPELTRTLDANSDRGGMVHVVVNALGRIGADDARLSRLFNLLTHSSSYVRGEAATMLGYIGAAIQDLNARDRLVQELISILYDTGHALHYAVPLVGDAVAKSLYYIGTPEAETASKEWRIKRSSILASMQTDNNPTTD